MQERLKKESRCEISYDVFSIIGSNASFLGNDTVYFPVLPFYKWQ